MTIKGERVKGRGTSRRGTRWERFYKEDPRTLKAPPTAFSKISSELIRKNRIKNVIDLGCGVGRDSAVLAKAAKLVIGVDLAFSGAKTARKRSKRAFSLIQVDSRCLPLKDDSIGAIYCFGLLHEFTGRCAGKSVSATMDEIYRALRPKGMLFLTVLAGNPRSGLPHVRLFNKRMVGKVTHAFKRACETICEDIGCTGNRSYRIWRGIYRKRQKVR